jgi:hypothetical protein
MENKHFNYKVIQRTTLEGAEDILNMYGVQGWKLVGYSSDVVNIMSAIRTYQFILMREEN